MGLLPVYDGDAPDDIVVKSVVLCEHESYKRFKTLTLKHLQCYKHFFVLASYIALNCEITSIVHVVVVELQL